MPGFTSHYLFGVRIFEEINENPLKSVIQKNHHSYSLGLQGPDVFFYHIPSVISPGKNPGNVAHAQKTGLFLENLAKSCNLCSDEEASHDIAVAYLAGFLGHYTMDRICHPFVYARSSYTGGKKADSGRHFKLETDIDTTYLKREKNLKPSEFKKEKTIRLTPRESRIISRCLSYAYQKTFPGLNVTCEAAASAFSMMYKGAKLEHDPSGLKRTIVSVIEQKAFGYDYLTGMIESDHGLYHNDPCNLNHYIWKSPWEKENRRTESFFDLTDIAAKEYKHLEDFLSLMATFKDKEALGNIPEDISDSYSYLSGLKEGPA